MSGARPAMRQRCEVERDAAAPDAFGATAAPDWQSHLTDVPCRVYTRLARAAVNAEKTTAVEDLRLLLPLGTDVTESDRIAAVADKLGATILDGPLLIDAVARRADHLELMLREVA